MKANVLIKVLEAVTRTNSVSKNSRIVGNFLTIGNEVYKREDGVFYENIYIDLKEFRPFYEFASNEITLECVSNNRVKTIIIKKFTIN